MHKILGEVIKFIENAMKRWRVEVTAGGKGLTEVKIQRGVFQGDTLKPLQFVIAMIPLNLIPNLIGNAQADTNSLNRKKKPTT